MRKSFVALLLLAGAAACLATAAFAADEIDGNDFGLKLNNARLNSLRSAAVKQGVSGAAAVGDTTWVGYSTAAGVTNYWSVGPGPNRPTPNTTGVWNWDVPVHGDSLQGWWPIRQAHTNTSGAVRTDENRPWWAIEGGNVANYVINQGAGFKRTTGVVGVWHRDPGNAVPGPMGDSTGVAWAPLGGSYSAWMGLRQHFDNTVVDPITGNPFNVDIMKFTGNTGGGTGSSKTFPGYGAQMDQMLYRDVDITGAAGAITLKFNFATQMSTLKGTAAASRTGWFEGDPLSINTITPGNFISAEAGTPANALAPIDSFQVYVGKPVEGTFVASDGVTRTIYDPLRRWFNEVLDKSQRLWVFGAAGVNANTAQTITIDAANVAALKAGGNNTLRVVFRVHTNAGSSDESGPLTFTSKGKGAAQVDEVKIDIGAGDVTIGDFEAAGSIDNTASASTAWRSTGKPPAIYFHAEDLNNLAWNDICGSVTSPIRICDMRGGVVSWGDHDRGEAAGGDLGTTEEEGNWSAASPTIGLVASSGVPNSFGLTLEQATPTQGYNLIYELYMGIFDLFNTGNAWQYMAMAYPALQRAGGPATGTPQWGELRLPPFLYFNPLVQCYASLEDLSANGQILSANGSGLAKPDSLIISMRKLQQCYRFGVTTGCSPTGGAYMDNVALAIIDGSPQSMAVDIWNWFNDTFPFNETAGLPSTANFDTAAALIRTGFNVAQATGNLQRFDVPGDSVIIGAPAIPGEQIRVDMIFRIKPGVGNYITVGSPASGLRDVPTSTAPASGNPNSFWTQYLTAPGDFSTPGAAGLDAGWPGGWNPNVWRSARCDTVQGGLFPVEHRGFGDFGNIGALDANYWMSTLHESDAHYTALGISRHKCFVMDTTGAANAANITCSTVPSWLTDPVTGPRAGYDGNANTIEGTKIIPDGLLTPGAHVQYFFTKRTLSTPTVFDMVPDTNTVFTQPLESNFDAHRWQQFGVLPDRWKDTFFGGQGMACMLYVDLNDRRGDERIWVSVADSIGATSVAKYGAPNGWHAPAGVTLNTPSNFVAAHGGQPGTTWDMYGVKASESLTTSAGALGGRLAYRDPSPLNLVDGKYAKMAPTPEMMETFYKLVLILTGDLNSGVFGPFNDRSQDDKGFLTTYLQGATLGAPRGLMIQGDGWAESEAGYPFLTDVLGVDLLWSSYLELSTNNAPVSDLIVQTAVMPAPLDIYGVRNGCTFTNDVLSLNTAIPEAVVSSYYTPVVSTQFISGVLKKQDPARPWIALSDGFDIFNLTGRFDASNKGRLAYYYNVMKNVFASFCVVNGAVTTGFETPNASQFVNFARLTSANPIQDRKAVISLSTVKSDRITIKVYDVTGRLIRTVADQVFPAGQRTVTWDGVDDHGTLVPRGVYFAKTTFAGQNFQSANKMIVLN